MQFEETRDSLRDAIAAGGPWARPGGDGPPSGSHLDWYAEMMTELLPWLADGDGTRWAGLAAVAAQLGAPFRPGSGMADLAAAVARLAASGGIASRSAALAAASSICPEAAERHGDGKTEPGREGDFLPAGLDLSSPPEDAAGSLRLLRRTVALRLSWRSGLGEPAGPGDALAASDMALVSDSAEDPDAPPELRSAAAAYLASLPPGASAAERHDLVRLMLQDVLGGIRRRLPAPPRYARREVVVVRDHAERGLPRRGVVASVTRSPGGAGWTYGIRFETDEAGVLGEEDLVGTGVTLPA